MRLSQDDVIQILKMINESSFEELHLKMGDMEINVSKSGCRISSDLQESPLKNPVGSAASENRTRETKANNNEPLGKNQTSGSHVVQKNLEHEIANQGFIPIKLPMLGIFYKAPKPGAPPFVEVDSLVEDDTTVCTIEVMKLFSTIKAGVRGRIKQTCAENGEMVEYGQILFIVDPNTD